jgi:hypothetical protein
MFIVFPRAAKPDAAHWPGRRLFAAIDAVLWPAVWVLLVVYASLGSQLVGQVIVALAVYFGITRLWRAAFRNERYWFTTWRWGKVLAALLLIGLALKLAQLVAH